MILKVKFARERGKAGDRSGKRRLKWFALPLAIAGLGWGYHDLRESWLEPKAIFVLGGHEERERAAARLAGRHRDLPIWVSSGSPRPYALKIFQHARIAPERLHLDYEAGDTVTNFTTLVDELAARGIDSVYLVTSRNHMGRARLVGEIIFGSRGISIKPVPVPSRAPDEPLGKYLRDGARALLWVMTGSTGESWLDSR